MKHFFEPMAFLFIAFLASVTSIAQTPIDTLQNREVFATVEESAIPPGGMTSFYKFLASNIKYPRDARKAKIEGKVFVQFVVERNGSISDETVRVIRSVSQSLDDEAIRVIKLSPNWTPGTQDGIPVRVQMVLPIIFKL